MNIDAKIETKQIQQTQKGLYTIIKWDYTEMQGKINS